MISDEQLRLFMETYGRQQQIVDALACETCGAPAGQNCPPNEFGKPDIHLARAQAGVQLLSVVHACPPGQEQVMPCCGRTPFEVPPYHRMTLNPALVTCVPLTGPSEPPPVD